MENNPPPDRMRTITYIVYGAMAAGVILPLLPLAGVIAAHLKRPEAAGTIYESHFTWLIRTFWIAVAITLGVIFITMPIPHLGMLILALVGLWTYYRLIKGALKLSDGKPIDDPRAYI